MQQVTQDIVENVGKALPPAVISATSFMGVGWDNWVYILTAGYITLQSWFLIYRWWYEHKGNHRKKDEG